MAATRGRDLASMGGLFTSVALSGATGAPAEGQPFWMRYFGIPTHPAFAGRWDILIPPFIALMNLIKRLMEKA